jgi:hypothetical protein
LATRTHATALSTTRQSLYSQDEPSLLNLMVEGVDRGGLIPHNIFSQSAGLRGTGNVAAEQRLSVTACWIGMYANSSLVLSVTPHCRSQVLHAYLSPCPPSIGTCKACCSHRCDHDANS